MGDFNFAAQPDVVSLAQDDELLVRRPSALGAGPQFVSVATLINAVSIAPSDVTVPDAVGPFGPLQLLFSQGGAPAKMTLAQLRTWLQGSAP